MPEPIYRRVVAALVLALGVFMLAVGQRACEECRLARLRAFGRGQNALEANHQKIADQVGVNVLGSPAHVFLLEACNPVADSGFDFSLRFHGDLECAPVWGSDGSVSRKAGSVISPGFQAPSWLPRARRTVLQTVLVAGGGGPNPLKELRDMFAQIPGYIPYMIVSSVLGLIMAIVLIVAGIGLLKMRPWAGGAYHPCPPRSSATADGS